MQGKFYILINTVLRLYGLIILILQSVSGSSPATFITYSIRKNSGKSIHKHIS